MYYVLPFDVLQALARANNVPLLALDQMAQALLVTAGDGLTANYTGGRARIDQTVYDIPDGVIGLATGTTNYVYVNSAGAVATGLAGFPANSIPMATVVTGLDYVISVVDNRCAFYEDTAAGGGADPDALLVAQTTGIL